MDKRSIIRGIKAFPRRLEEHMSYQSRCNGGHDDLVKALPQASPVTVEQKQRIEAFWKAYLTTWKEKKAFDLRWFDIYNRTNVFGFKLEQYIPDSYYYAIVDNCLTNTLDAPVLDDKNLYDLLFHDVNQPLTLIRKSGGVILDNQYNPISEDEALRCCVANGRVILKPSVDAMAGQGIEIWQEGRDDIKRLRQLIARTPNLVVQDFIRQHPFLSAFTDSCVNTMRIVTLLWEGEVKVTTAVLIMGGPKAKTNHLHGGGIVCGILPDGQLRHTAFDGQLNEYKVHPNGIRFADVRIPNYDKCIDLVKRLAPRMAGVSKFLNWDLTLDENGEPLLIEVNLTWGGSVQIAAGPAFGDMTREVLDYVKREGRWK